MLPEVITSFLTNEQIPVSKAQAFALYVTNRGDIISTLSALRRFEDDMRFTWTASAESKARELSAQLALRARERAGVSIEARPKPARLYSIAQLEELLLA